MNMEQVILITNIEVLPDDRKGHEDESFVRYTLKCDKSHTYSVDFFNEELFEDFAKRLDNGDNTPEIGCRKCLNEKKLNKLEKLN